jgi:hypothetical protein
VIGIQEWISDLLMSRGALVELDARGRISAMLPAEAAATLGAPEWLALEPGADDTEWLDRMERLLPPQPLLVEAQFRAPRLLPPIDPATVLDSGLTIQNGIWRVIEERDATATYLFFTFQYTIESDDRSMGVVTCCLNADGGSQVPMPENFLLGLRDGLVERDGIADPALWEQFRAAALCAAQAAVRKHAAQAEENANRRLARDTRRVESYYDSLLKQIEKRNAKRAGDSSAAEKERSRAQATHADRAAKLEDLQRKYALRVRIEPALLLAVRAPVRRISLRIIRKKEERPRALDWNPILGILELPMCEHCSAPAHPLYLCERIHLLCKACWKQCPTCSRFFCAVCHPYCKCERAKAAAG